MQAEATGGAAAGAGGASGSFLQNPKVQIGVIVIGAIALIVVIWMVFFPSSGEQAGPVANPAVAATPSGASTAGADDPAAGSYPAATGAPTPGAASTPAAPAATPAAPAAAASPGQPGAEAAPAPAGPGVKTRKNPFAPNTEVRKIIDAIPGIINPPPAAEPISPELRVYHDLYKPKPNEQVTTGEESDGPPIPAMRVAGVIHGSQAGPTATMQIGDQFMQVTPGKMIPEGNPIYRVERIEQDRVILTRRWEMGDRKGVQRIEVNLAGSAGSTGGMFGAPGGGSPGGGYPGGYPGGLN